MRASSLALIAAALLATTVASAQAMPAAGPNALTAAPPVLQEDAVLQAAVALWRSVFGMGSIRGIFDKSWHQKGSCTPSIRSRLDDLEGVGIGRSPTVRWADSTMVRLNF